MKLEDVHDAGHVGAQARIAQPRQQLLPVHLFGLLPRRLCSLGELLQFSRTHGLLINHPFAHGVLIRGRAWSAADAHANATKGTKLKLLLDSRAVARLRSVA